MLMGMLCTVKVVPDVNRAALGIQQKMFSSR